MGRCTPQEARRLLLLNTLEGLSRETLRGIRRDYLQEFTPELLWKSEGTPNIWSTAVTSRGGMISFECYHGFGMWSLYGTPDQWAYWDYPEIELGEALSQERFEVLVRIPPAPSLETPNAVV